MNLTIKDFYPINNKWTPEVGGSTWGHVERRDDGDYRVSSGVPRFIVDGATNKKYLNEDLKIIRIKCFLLTLGTPVVHSIAALYAIASKTLKIATFYHFRKARATEPQRPKISTALKATGIDLLKIVAAPLAWVGLELAAVYGIFRPLDGRKLYASIERAEYGSFVLAPCFQPEPTHHALGGDITQHNAF